MKTPGERTPCLPCNGRLADRYGSAAGHKKACGVISLFEPIGDRVYHKADRVKHYGGSWDLNVYIARCGTEPLTRGRGNHPCPECFPSDES